MPCPPRAAPCSCFPPRSPPSRSPAAPIGDDGPRTSQTRDVADFTRIDNSGSVDVRLHVGEPQRVRVRAGEKVIDDVRTEVRDGTLHRHVRPPRLRRRATSSSRLSVPKLTGIDASGSGDVDADGIDADAFEVRSDGSADIALAGTAGRLAVDLERLGRRGPRRA